jgi:peptidoglycan/xylan/chitin deacetylase (PgdA/CDA1 family)
VSPTQILAAIRGEGELPERSLIVTFDDGLREQFEYAWPILQRTGIPAVFFVNTSPIEKSQVSMVHKIHLLRAHVAPELFLQTLREQARRYEIDIDLHVDREKATLQYKYDTPEAAELKYLLNFTLEREERDKLIEGCFDKHFAGLEASISRELYMNLFQIAELGSHGFIGTHAHQHLPLGLLSAERIEENISTSVLSIAEWTGSRPVALSYPYGSREACTPAVAKSAADFGIAFAFTMERAGNPDLRHPFFLARFANNDLPGGKDAQWTGEEVFRFVPHASWYRQ